MTREKNTPTGRNKNSVRQLSDAELAEHAKQARQEAAEHSAALQLARQTLRQPPDSKTAADAARSLLESGPAVRRATGRVGAVEAEIKRREQREEQERLAKEAHLAQLHEAAQQVRTASDRRLIEQAEQRLRQQQLLQPTSSRNGRRSDAQPAVSPTTEDTRRTSSAATSSNQNGRHPEPPQKQRTPEEEADLLKGVAHAVTGLYAHDVKRVPKRGESVSPEDSEVLAQIAEGARSQMPPMKNGRPHGYQHAGRALAGRAGRMIDNVNAGTATPQEQEVYEDVKALAEQSGRNIRIPNAAKKFAGSRMVNLFSQAGSAKKSRS